ncbi:hypothetical protein ATANTOWER_021069 [Ataeniobius toweri]|uniref:Uncharacterized protein n=1 Tax=Ataeniobius toweri TaxID=208326 RepID=A0ABU7CG17_9TELE|nr:hypothetical protein [Ataeniobius toweri]
MDPIPDWVLFSLLDRCKNSCVLYFYMPSPCDNVTEICIYNNQLLSQPDTGLDTSGRKSVCATEFGMNPALIFSFHNLIFSSDLCLEDRKRYSRYTHAHKGSVKVGAETRLGCSMNIN